MTRIEPVTKSVDGDTFKTSNRMNPVRLANVDTPELGTRRGKAAKHKLEKVINGEPVSIETVACDRYGHSVAAVKLGRKSVNRTTKDDFDHLGNFMSLTKSPIKAVISACSTRMK